MGAIILGTIFIILGLGAIIGVSLIKFAFAFVLIAIGIRIIVGKDHHYHGNWDFKSAKQNTNDHFINEMNIFSSADTFVKSDDFKGGKMVIILSGGKIDLSQVKTTEKNIKLEVVVIMGEAELVIPKGWKVNSQGTSIFGGYDAKIEEGGNDTTLYLKGAAILGGIKIRN